MHKLFLIIIICAAILLRVWGIGYIPPSPDWDEAALGYNSYSILQTGKDEYGNFFPIILQSFNDYKPALYAYLAIPFVAIFDLNLFAVRLPSVVFGVLTVIAVYFLVLQLFRRKDVALVSSLLLAISPMSIQFSRIAFEANIGLAFNVFAALFFIKSFNKPLFLFFFAIFMGLNIYVYQSEKVFMPLLFFILTIIYRKEILSIARRYIFGAFFILIVVLLPSLYFFATNPQSFSRARGVSIFSEKTYHNQGEGQRSLDDKEVNNPARKIFHNKYVAYAKEMLSGYLSHYNLNWYFIEGDLERHHAPGMGMLYLWEMPFLFIGIYMLLFGKYPYKSKLLIFLWFLLAPLPASFAEGTPHAIRTLNFLPTFQIFTALGLLAGYRFIADYKRKIFKYRSVKFMFYILFLAIVTFNFVYFINQYFVQQNYFNSYYWQYGYKEVVSYVQKIEKNYKKIIVSNKIPLDQSYIFFLFYMKYPPEKYQQLQDSHNATSGRFDDTHKFEKYEFRPIDWDKEEKLADTLYIGSPQDFSGIIHPIFKVNFLNGQDAIYIVKG